MNSEKAQKLIALSDLRIKATQNRSLYSDEPWDDLLKVLGPEINGLVEDLAYGKDDSSDPPKDPYNPFSSLFAFTPMVNDVSLDEPYYMNPAEPLSKAFSADWSKVDLSNLATLADKDKYYKEVLEVMEECLQNPDRCSLKEKILAWAVFNLNCEIRSNKE